MKTKITLLAVILFSALCNANAQTVVELSEAGTLQAKISEIGTDNIQWLKIKGDLNGTDIRYLRRLAGYAQNNTTPIVEFLDLSEADIVSGGDYYYAYEGIMSDLSDLEFFYTEDHILGDYMFSNCQWLQEIIPPASTKRIGKGCFEGIGGLQFFDVPEGIERIEAWTFASCRQLKEVTLPTTVLSVDKYAFASCNNLKKLVCLSIDPPAYGFRSFSTPEAITLSIRNAAYMNIPEFYYEAEGWKNFGTITTEDEIRGGVKLSKTNFPDDTFRKLLLNGNNGADGILTDEELAEVKELHIQGSNIQTLKGIEYFTALTGLWCADNLLTELDLSKNTALTKLYCNGNQLTALDLSNNTALQTLSCYQNQIKGEEMDALVESLPTTTDGTMYVMWSEDEQNEMTTEQVAVAKSKGWKPCVYVKDFGWKEYVGSIPVALNEIIDNPSQNAEKQYDLQGRQLNGKPEKGIYIQNGKKVRGPL